MSHALTPEDWDVFQEIMAGGEDIDLVPAVYNGVEVAQIVRWRADIDGSNPTYTVLAVLATPDFLSALSQPELSPLSV
jgi:hypothetical protein